ncbi:MAG TPA: hypothetical protein VK860_15250 [Ilumatobacteraceae bacterium]|nr:hypothetical protein [Ilumatobacteraceae bacterium]
MTTDDSTISSWFLGRLPDAWTTTAPANITVDRDEITIVLTIPAPDLPADAADADRAEAIDGRITGFREDTREQRVAIAREAEHRFDRKVAWGVSVGGRTALFTHLAAPVMTRLRQPERLVLDTLVAANVARSRADALAWCVRLVGRNTDTWLSELREAMQTVDRLRSEGPDTA